MPSLDKLNQDIADTSITWSYINSMISHLDHR
jgi:hypothetical protein